MCHRMRCFLLEEYVLFTLLGQSPSLFLLTHPLLFSPAQPTDLVFLVDGSGSIGSYVFQNEVCPPLSYLFIHNISSGPSIPLRVHWTLRHFSSEDSCIRRSILWSDSVSYLWSFSFFSFLYVPFPVTSSLWATMPTLAMSTMPFAISSTFPSLLWFFETYLIFLNFPFLISNWSNSHWSSNRTRSKRGILYFSRSSTPIRCHHESLHCDHWWTITGMILPPFLYLIFDLSQDNVTIPSNNARMQNIQMFAVGVTNHVSTMFLIALFCNHTDLIWKKLNRN